MKRASLLTVLVLSFASATAFASAKMDLPLQMLVGQPHLGKALLGKAVTAVGGLEQADVIIKSSDPDATAAAIEEAGGEVRAVLGEIMTAFVPVKFFPVLESREEVIGIEASRPLRPLMDSARANTNATQVQTSYDGTNVVVGVIDTGLDYSRADFQTSAGASRVQYLRFQSIGSSGQLTATTCTKGTIDAGTCAIAADNDSAEGHGTHVTGIAAGNGGGTNYIGMAPAADIMLVRNAFSDYITDAGSDGSATFSSSVLDGVAAIFEKAALIDKAAVINLSQGTHVGAHDGTSLLEQGLNSAAAAATGRAIAVAAGNEHIVYATYGGSQLTNVAGGIHAPVSVPDGSSSGYRLWLWDQPVRDQIEVDAWFGAGQSSTCFVMAQAYSNLSKAFVTKTLTTTDTQVTIAELPLSTDNSGTTAATADNKVEMSAGIDASDAQNGKSRALFFIGPGSAGSWSDITIALDDGGNFTAGYIFDIVVRAAGGACSGDIWIEGGGANASAVHFLKGIDTGAFDVGGAGGYAMKVGDNNSTVDIPGTALGVITVGAYLQQKPAASGASTWTDSAGTTYDATVFTSAEPNPQINGVSSEGLGGRTPFSSIGPTIAVGGSQKPDLLAPGDPIISVLPTGYVAAAPLQVDATHYKSQGTSQAAPQVAGIVALLFQMNSCLTAAEVKTALMNSADTTQSGYEAAKDGAGKIDAAAALAAISAPSSQCHTGTGDVPDDGGGSSGGGCGGSLVPVAAAPSAAGLAGLLALLPILAIAGRRLKRKP